MIVNMDFMGKVMPANPARRTLRPNATPVNLSGDAKIRHQKLMEYRHRAEALESDMRSAMASLESANKDIDRLNAEICRLNQELQKERDKNAKYEKAEKSAKKGAYKPKKEAASEPPPEAEA